MLDDVHARHADQLRRRTKVGRRRRKKTYEEEEDIGSKCVSY